MGSGRPLKLPQVAQTLAKLSQPSPAVCLFRTGFYSKLTKIRDFQRKKTPFFPQTQTGLGPSAAGIVTLNTKLQGVSENGISYSAFNIFLGGAVPISRHPPTHIYPFCAYTASVLVQ